MLPTDNQQIVIPQVTNKPNKKNIPMPILVGIIAVVIIVVIAIIIVGNKKPSAPTAKPQTTVSTTVNTTAETTTKQITTEQTTKSTTQSTRLGEINNIKTECYDIPDDEGGGYAGIIIGFDPVKNADGYRLEYVFEDYDGNQTSGFQDIDQNQVKLYVEGQDFPAMIKATAFKDDEGMHFSEEVVLYDGYNSHFHTSLTNEEWNNLKRGYNQLNPFDYYEY